MRGRKDAEWLKKFDTIMTSLTDEQKAQIIWMAERAMLLLREPPKDGVPPERHEKTVLVNGLLAAYVFGRDGKEWAAP